MPNRRILGGWYGFFDDDQPVQGAAPAGGMAAALAGSSTVSGTLTEAPALAAALTGAGGASGTLTVNIPRRRGRGGGGGGGGGPWLRLPIHRKIQKKDGELVPAGAEGFAKSVAMKLLEGPSAVPHPGEKIPKKQRDAEVERLRRRVKAYQKRIRKLYESRTGKREQVEAENELLRDALEKLEAATRKVVEEATQEAMSASLRQMVAAEVNAKIPATAGVAGVKSPLISISRLALAAGIFVAAKYAIPDDAPVLRGVGYGVAAAVAISSLSV